MKDPLPASRWGRAAIIVGLVTAGGAMAVLFYFDPSTHPFYPVCPLHQTTGLLCPGCGTLRALHQLVHGNFAAAWRFNPFMMSLLPVGFWLALRELIKMTTAKELPGLVLRPAFGWGLLAAMLIFGVLRNV